MYVGLSVYYNINDDGHNAVKKWIESDDSKEANTPRNDLVWKILLANDNIKSFQDEIDLKGMHSDLGYLHNYVHTKGHKFGNEMGVFSSNCQTFEPANIEKWLVALNEIAIIVTTLHLLKYPTALMDYNYGKKFGVDIPAFPQLQHFEQENIEKMLPEAHYKLLHKIASNDPQTKEFTDWISNLPDMTKEEVQNQILEIDKNTVERQGLSSHHQNLLNLYGVTNLIDLPDEVKERVEIIDAWALENDFIEPKLTREARDKLPN